jgi:hypothetical protein
LPVNPSHLCDAVGDCTVGAFPLCPWAAVERLAQIAYEIQSALFIVQSFADCSSTTHPDYRFTGAVVLAAAHSHYAGVQFRDHRSLRHRQ